MDDDTKQPEKQTDDLLSSKDNRQIYCLQGSIVFKTSSDIVANAKLQELIELFQTDPNITVLPESNMNMGKVVEKPIITTDKKIIT